MNTQIKTTYPEIQHPTAPAGQTESALEVSTRALDMLEILNRLLDHPSVHSDEEIA